MTKAFLAVLTLAAATAQTAPNSVTVTASRTSTLQPDQMVFAIFVNSPLNTTRDNVLSALQGAGITLANFSGVSSQQQPGTALVWSFGLAVPIANTKSAVAQLNSLQQAMAQLKNGLSMSFSVQGTQVSQQLQQAQACSISDLLSDARSQAQQMALAGGVSLGSILAISTSISTPVPGDDALSAARYNALSGYSNPPACSLTVKFALGGF